MEKVLSFKKVSLRSRRSEMHYIKTGLILNYSPSPVWIVRITVIMKTNIY